MKTLRWLATIVVACLLFLPTVITAQEATPGLDGIERQTLVEMTISPDQMPEQLAKVGFDRHTVQPGVVAEFDQADEGIRGRTIYLESGTLIVEPLVPSPVWRAGSPIGSDPEMAQPGDQVQLEVGDSMYLPAMSVDQFGPDDRIRISNPGTEPAVQIGVHLHQSSGTFSPPSGYSYSSGASVFLPAELEPITTGDTMFQLSRVTAEPGAVLPFPEGAVTVFYQVDGGQLTSTFTGTDARPVRVPAGSATVASTSIPNQQISVSSDAPAEVIELAIFPSALPLSSDSAASPEATVASPVAATTAIGGDHPIVGTWVVRPADPSIPFALMQFHADGTVTNTNPNVGDGIGVWVANDDGTVDANVIFRDTETEIGQYAPGTLRATGTVKIDASNNRFEATVAHTSYSETGAVKDTFDLDEVGTRLNFGVIPGWVSTTPPTTPTLVSAVETLAAPVDHPIVGTWVFLSDNLGSPVALVTLNADGTAIDHNAVLGTGLGVWAPNADGTVSLLLVFQDIDVAYGAHEPGVSAVEGFLTLAPDDRTLDAGFTYPLIDPEGNIREAYAGTEQAVRMTIDSDITWTTLPDPPEDSAPVDAEAMTSHPIVGAWIVDSLDDATLPVSIGALHPDGTVVVQNPALGLSLGVWVANPDGTATLRIVWQDSDPAVSLATPGLIVGTTTFTLDPGGSTISSTPSIQITDVNGTPLGAGTYRETGTRFNIDSAPGWTETSI